MPNFDATTSTVGMKRDYADCVFEVYGSGEPMSQSLAILIKIAIVLAFVGIGAGVWHARRGYNDIAETIFYALFGGVLLPTGFGFLIAAYYGIAFLFS